MQSNKLFYPSGALYADLTETKRTYFYEDGTLKTVEPYSEGKLQGEVLLFWQNGKIKRRSHFERGIRHGLDEMWSEEGQLVDEGRYEEGKPVGMHRRWNAKGDLIEEIGYIDAHRFNFRQWDEWGQLRFEGIWTEQIYFEKKWDRLQKIWEERQARWDGKKLVYV